MFTNDEENNTNWLLGRKLRSIIARYMDKIKWFRLLHTSFLKIDQLPTVIKKEVLCMQNDFRHFTFCWLQYGDKETVSQPQHDKNNKLTVRPANTQISLGIRSESCRAR